MSALCDAKLARSPIPMVALKVRRKCVVKTHYGTSLRIGTEIRCFCLSGNQLLLHDRGVGDHFIIETDTFISGSTVRILDSFGRAAVAIDGSGSVVLVPEDQKNLMSAFQMTDVMSGGDRRSTFLLKSVSLFLRPEVPDSIAMITSGDVGDRNMFMVSFVSNPIHDAIRSTRNPPEKLGAIDKAIQAGWDVNSPDEEGLTPLQLTASNGDHPEIVVALIGHHARVDFIPEVGTKIYCSALGYASLKGHVGAIRKLLDAGANTELSRASDGAVPLHLAARNGHAGAATLLFGSNESTIWLTDKSDRTALHLLLDRPGELSAEQLLFAEMVVSRGFDIDLVDSEGATALHVAARQGHLRGVVLLLTLGAKTLLKNTAREGLRHHSHLGKHAAKKYASDVVPEGAFAVRAAILQEMVKEWQRVIAALVDLQVPSEDLDASGFPEKLKEVEAELAALSAKHVCAVEEARAAKVSYESDVAALLGEAAQEAEDLRVRLSQQIEDQKRKAAAERAKTLRTMAAHASRMKGALKRITASGMQPHARSVIADSIASAQEVALEGMERERTRGELQEAASASEERRTTVEGYMPGYVQLFVNIHLAAAVAPPPAPWPAPGGPSKTPDSAPARASASGVAAEAVCLVDEAPRTPLQTPGGASSSGAASPSTPAASAFKAPPAVPPPPPSGKPLAGVGEARRKRVTGNLVIDVNNIFASGRRGNAKTNFALKRIGEHGDSGEQKSKHLEEILNRSKPLADAARAADWGKYRFSEKELPPGKAVGDRTPLGLEVDEILRFFTAESELVSPERAAAAVAKFDELSRNFHTLHLGAFLVPEGATEVAPEGTPDKQKKGWTKWDGTPGTAKLDACRTASRRCAYLADLARLAESGSPFPPAPAAGPSVAPLLWQVCAFALPSGHSLGVQQPAWPGLELIGDVPKRKLRDIELVDLPMFIALIETVKKELEEWDAAKVDDTRMLGRFMDWDYEAARKAGNASFEKLMLAFVIRLNFVGRAACADLEATIAKGTMGVQEQRTRAQRILAPGAVKIAGAETFQTFGRELAEEVEKFHELVLKISGIMRAYEEAHGPFP